MTRNTLCQNGKTLPQFKTVHKNIYTEVSAFNAFHWQMSITATITVLLDKKDRERSLLLQGKNINMNIHTEQT